MYNKTEYELCAARVVFDSSQSSLARLYANATEASVKEK